VDAFGFTQERQICLAFWVPWLSFWALGRLHTLMTSMTVSRRGIGQQIVFGLSVACIFLMLFEGALIYLTFPYVQTASLEVWVIWQATLDVLAGASLALLLSSLVMSFRKHKIILWGLIICASGLFSATVLPEFLPHCRA
jgi:hypothetical protein